MSKYHSRKQIRDGIRFDSIKEADRYTELSILQKAGEISELKTQVVFELIPRIKTESVTERPVRYIADFTYKQNGKLVVEDAKGVKTRDYIIKRKLMLFIKGIEAHEI